MLPSSEVQEACSELRPLGDLLSQSAERKARGWEGLRL